MIHPDSSELCLSEITPRIGACIEVRSRVPASDWAKNLRDFRQRAIAIRRNSDALQQGGFQLLRAAGDLVAFQRRARQAQMIVAAWRGEDDMPAAALDMRKADVPDSSALTDLLTGDRYETADGALRLKNLAHGQALFLRVEA